MRIVAHVDMDAFFAAVEEHYNPQFRGLPIVVGADPKVRRAAGGEPRPTGRGVVSTSSYAARKYGIRSAMPVTQAWRLSEEARMRGEAPAVFLTGQYSLYSEVSERIMAIIESETDRFEQASVDEAYLEWDSGIDWEKAEKKAKEIKKKILKQEGLTCSVGIAPNKLVAKIASDYEKPDGLTIVRPEFVERFLSPMSIRRIPGIGPKSEVELNTRGLKTIADVQNVSRDFLVEALGKWGSDLYDKVRGISDGEVSNDWVAKSIGEEETFEKDSLEAGFILDHMRDLAAYVFKRLAEGGFKSFRTVVIKVRFSDFTTMTRSHTSSKALTTIDQLNGEALRLFLPFLDGRENPKKKKIRLIGVRVENLE